MKILISSDGINAHYFERLGLAKVSTFCNFETILYDISGKSSLDQMDEFEPDILISQVYNLDEGMLQAIKERPKLKIYLKVGDSGDYCKFYSEKYQILTATEKDKNKVRKILDNGNDLRVGCHYIDDRLHITHNYWEDMGCKLLSMGMAADLFDYTNGTELDYLRSDISVISGYWGYKGRRISEYLFPLFNPNYNYKIKLFGSSVWPSSSYCGFIETDMVKHIMRSATINPSIHEPHIELGMEVCERPMKILSNKSFCVSDYGEDLAKIFNEDELVFAKNPIEFKNLIDHYLQYPEQRLPFIENGYKAVISKHTYFHRLCSLFQSFSLNEESENINKGLETFKNERQL